jgi:hypothetical protein
LLPGPLSDRFQRGDTANALRRSRIAPFAGKVRVIATPAHLTLDGFADQIEQAYRDAERA